MDALLMAAGSLQKMLPLGNNAKCPSKKAIKAAKHLKKKFIEPKNLEYLARIAFEEKNNVEYLMTGIKRDDAYKTPGDTISEILRDYGNLEVMLYSALPKHVISTKEEYRQILDNAKPHFIGLTGISLEKEPDIEIITSKAKIAYGLAKPVMAAAFILGAVASGISWIAGADLCISLAAAFTPPVVFSSAAFAAAYYKIRDTAGFTMPPKFSDTIYLMPYQYAEAASLACHEYTHNIFYKAGHSTNEPFLEEGLATAVASRILKMHESTQHTELAAYGAMDKVCRSMKSFAMLSRCFGMELNIWAYHPFSLDLNVKPAKMIKSSLFNYFGGASMIEIAEFKYGTGIYKDIFNGKYDCLLD